MKKRLILLGTVLTMLTGGAEPVKALLVVQNHAGAECRIKLPNLATRLSAALSGETFEVEFDNIVNGIGFVPAPLASAGKKNVYKIGDCKAIGNLRTAIWRAWDVCMKI